MMKANKMTLAIVVALFAAPVMVPKAHAISESYRKQLEISGCTQMTDGHGCDIHRTKAQNEAAKAKPMALTDRMQSLSDKEICSALGKAQARHDKAAYGLYSTELNVRETAKTFTLDQAACTALATAEINKHNKDK